MRALIFDLDGTLVDTVYGHILAWQRTFAEAGMAIEGWRIHRRIGMSGGLFTRGVARELGREILPEEEEALQRRHGEIFIQLLPERRPLSGTGDFRNGRTPFEKLTADFKITEGIATVEHLNMEGSPA